MKLVEIIERATDFGSFRSSQNFFSFTLKMILYIIPAVIILVASHQAQRVQVIDPMISLLSLFCSIQKLIE